MNRAECRGLVRELARYGHLSDRGDITPIVTLIELYLLAPVADHGAERCEPAGIPFHRGKGIGPAEGYRVAVAERRRLFR